MTNFTNRKTYLEYRADWKARYKELSEEIRETRAAIKTSDQDRASVLQAEKAMLRRKANRMMLELTEAKLEAQRQYEAEHAKVAA